MLRVLVVDDEPLGRQRILDLLEDEPDVEVIGTAADGVAAIEAIRRARRHVDSAGRERLHEQLLALLHGGAATAAASPPPPGEPSRFLERIAVRMSGK